MILDSQGREVKNLPEWHKDIQTEQIIQWSGHWFSFVGIDPNHDPDVVIFKYKGPTKATKRRNDAPRN